VESTFVFYAKRLYAGVLKDQHFPLALERRGIIRKILFEARGCSAIIKNVYTQLNDSIKGSHLDIQYVSKAATLIFDTPFPLW
jgi:hypothetical protein